MDIDNLVIVSAAPFEVQPLKEKYPSLSFIECGIGSLEASFRSCYYLEYLKDKDVIFVGTCGSFSKFRKIELVCASKLLWMDVGERIGYSQSIERLYPGVDVDSHFFAELNEKIVVTSPSISQSSFIHPQCSLQTDCQHLYVENLEAYAFFAPLQNILRSFHIILAVTNELCLSARQQWRENFRIAAQLSSEYLLNKLNINNG